MAKAKTPAPDTAEEMVALVAIEPIRHDGEDIPPGEPFNAPAAAVEALIACGAAQRLAE